MNQQRHNVRVSHDFTDDEDDIDGSGLSSSVLDVELSWMEWYCKLRENRFFVEVEEEYVRDDFNLTGLGPHVPHYSKALDMILSEDDVSEDSESETTEIVNQSASLLFGLIHARYILTAAGLTAMAKKFQEKIYGVCPNSGCHEQPMMPCGLSDFPKVHKAVVVCPSCSEIYWPLSKRLASLDGSYFGTSFASIFFLHNPGCVINQNKSYYIPRVCGFKVSPLCRSANRADEEKEAAAKNQNFRMRSQSALQSVSSRR